MTFHIAEVYIGFYFSPFFMSSFYIPPTYLLLSSILALCSVCMVCAYMHTLGCYCMYNLL